MKSNAITLFIIKYFRELRTNSQFAQLLCLKESVKLSVCTWILTACGTHGFAVGLKEVARKEGVHLQKDTPVKPGDRIYISISGASNGIVKPTFERLLDQCTRLLESGCYIIQDNWNNASRQHNRATEGELYTYLKNKGYHVSEFEQYAEWCKLNPKKEEFLIVQGPGNSWDYNVVQNAFLEKHAHRKATIRVCKDKVKFINFSGIDLVMLKEILGPKLIDNVDVPYYKPDPAKYNKSKEALVQMLTYLTSKGMHI